MWRIKQAEWARLQMQGMRLQADRHIVAAWNIAAKHPMRRPSPAKTLNKPLTIEVRGMG